MRLLILICMFTGMIACSKKSPLEKVLHRNKELMQIALNPEHEVQILYTSVNLKDTSFTRYEFQLDDTKYFYPASVVKMPVAVLAIEKINEISKTYPTIVLDTDLMVGKARPAQTEDHTDSTTVSGKPNMRRYIEKLFCVSDNNAYNRLYEFLGQDEINSRLRAKGFFEKSVINHRLGVAGFSFEEQRLTNPVTFINGDQWIYTTNPVYSETLWKHQASGSVKGVAYLDHYGELINKPFDFSEKNFYSLQDMEQTIQRIIFPEKFETQERFDISESDRYFIKTAMSSLPRDYFFYRDDSTYYDGYAKFFLYGDTREDIPSYLKIYNKVGYAYGYLTDCAYIEDSKHNIAFFLTATIHVNKNKIYNDGVYEYKETGLPFLVELGRQIYQWELKNNKPSKN